MEVQKRKYLGLVNPGVDGVLGALEPMGNGG